MGDFRMRASTTLQPVITELFTQEELVGGLSELELDIFEHVNMLRTTPQQFADLMEPFRQYYEGELFKYPKEPIIRTKEGVAAFEEGLNYVRGLAPLPPFKLAMGLLRSCRDHLGDQAGPEKRTGHKGSDGSTPQTRASRYGEWGLVCGECLQYGEAEGLRVVLDWVVDDGVAGRGHRLAVTSAEFGTVGVAAGRHLGHGAASVLLLTDRFADEQEKLDLHLPLQDAAYAKARKKGLLKKNPSLLVETRVVERQAKKSKGNCAVC